MGRQRVSLAPPAPKKILQIHAQLRLPAAVMHTGVVCIYKVDFSEAWRLLLCNCMFA